MPSVVVQGPDGKTYSFPDGTTKESAVAYFKKKNLGAKSTAPSQSLLESRQAASKSEFEKNKPESTVGTRTREAAIGLLEPFTASSAYKTALSGAEAFNAALVGNLHPANELAKGIINAPIEPVKTFAEGLWEGDYDKASRGTGGIASQTVPVVAGVTEAAVGPVGVSVGDLRAKAQSLNIPERLQARANVNRGPAAPANWWKRAAIFAGADALGVRPLGEAVVAADWARNWQPYRNLKAAAQEGIARSLDIRKTPVAGAVLEHEPAGGIETTATPKTAAADQFKPVNTEPAPKTAASQEPIGAKRPEVAPEVAEHFNLGKDAQGSPLEEEVKPEEAHDPAKAIPGPEVGEAGTKEPNWKAIEQAIAPSGNKAKRASQAMNADGSSTPFGRKLVEQVPEIATATEATAPAALKAGYDRVVQNLNEVENQVPEGTTVDTIPITSSLFEMSQEYLDRGLPEVAKSIDKIREQWTGDNVPWGEFLARKRSFFQNHNLRSAPMKRAYGILMEASSRVSPEVSEANSNYSTVRRALDNANVDVNTGRRISDVAAKPAKSSSVPMSERAAPVKDVKPVRSRRDALDILGKE